MKSIMTNLRRALSLLLVSSLLAPSLASAALWRQPGGGAAADITDAGAVGIDLLQSVTVANALDALTFSTLAQALITDEAPVDMRGRIGAQEATALLDDFITLQGNMVQGDLLYYNGTDIVRLAAGTSGQFLKTLGAGANPAWDTIAGGGDMLAANNLSDVASAATARTNLGVTAATGGTMTTLTLAGVTTVGGTETLTAAAMAADEIDITKARNTKTVPASNPTYTFSGAPANGQTWALELTGDSAARLVTIPSTFDMQSQTTRTTFVMPASGKATIYWQNDGSVNRAWGIPPALDNYTATTDPAVTDDADDGYAVGSRWVNVSADRAYECVDASAGAAVWQRRYSSVFGASAIGLVPAAAASPDSTKYLSEDGTFTVPAGGYSAVDYADNATTHTGTLDPTVVAAWTRTIPANTLLANKRATVQLRLARSGNATAYTYRVLLGGVEIVPAVSITTASRFMEFVIVAKSNSAQRTFSIDTANHDSFGSNTVTATTRDGTASQDLTIEVTLGSTATVVTLAEFSLKVN